MLIEHARETVFLAAGRWSIIVVDGSPLFNALAGIAAPRGDVDALA